MSSEISNSVTEWLRLSEKGDEQAAARLWDRYFEQLITLARKRLRYSHDPIFDEEDLAIGVFASILNGIKTGRLSNVKDRTQLWKVLAWATRRRAVDQIRREHAGKRSKKTDPSASEPSPLFNHLFQATQASQPLPQSDIADHSLPAELLVEFQDEVQFLESKLPTEELRMIARLRLDGWLNTEIAARQGKSLSSIERKIRLIKDHWLKELDQ